MVLWRFAHRGNKNSIGKLSVTQHEIFIICGIKSSETKFWDQQDDIGLIHMEKIKSDRINQHGEV